MPEYITTQTKCGPVRGIAETNYNAYYGLTYAKAERFEYAVPVSHWDGVYDATRHGCTCPQTRTYYPHLEVPERLFYHKEFRADQEFSYSEDCLNLNIFTPQARSLDNGSAASSCPVIIFIHGGGFNSGANYDSAIQGAEYARHGIVFVSIHYRVGVFGYFAHEDIRAKYGREGNFGLDDQYTAICWVKEHIAAFGGDPNNITLMGQSAGAISIQYLCLSKRCQGLFQHVLMMSGAGLFPKFALPREAAATREYWQDVMHTCKVTTLEEFRNLDAANIFQALEEVKARRKDNTYNTMPVVDGYLITAPIDQLIQHPLDIDYMIGYTNNDMYAAIMAHIGHKFARQVHGYLYYFDIDAPGDDHNAAFHSADIRYAFGTLASSHRPYDAGDYQVSDMMMRYIAQFARTGDPNQSGLPDWKPAGKALHLQKPISKIKMGAPNWCKLIYHTIALGDPK